MHTRGLKLGVYSDRGPNDFSGKGLGMKGHEDVDAQWMARQGVDYLKVDDMSGYPHTRQGAYARDKRRPKQDWQAHLLQHLWPLTQRER